MLVEGSKPKEEQESNSGAWIADADDPYKQIMLLMNSVVKLNRNSGRLTWWRGCRVLNVIVEVVGVGW